MEEPHDEAQSLASLPAAVLHHIIGSLHTQADQRRLAASCCRLRALCAQAVHTLVLSQHDLEGYGEEALSAFPHAQQLVLSEVVLDTDFVSALADLAPQRLLHSLKTLQVIEPVETDGVQLLQLLNTFLQLTELYVRGCWSHDSCHQQPPQPQQLRKLTFHRNSNLDEAQLIQLLSAPAGSTWAESSEQQEATAVQLPDWCTALWNSFRSSDSSDRCSATAAGPFLPAWKHLTHLDLTACSKLGASLCPLLALCPRLHTLSLHSCFKVTDATLRELCTVLNSATTSNCAEKPSSSSIDSQAVAAGGPMITTNSVSHAPAHTSCSQVAAGPPLRALDLSYTRVKDAGMPHLAAALPKLSWLGLKGCNVGDDGLVHLLQLQHLTALHIKHCHRVTAEGIACLSSLNLHSLSWGYTSMPEADEVAALIGQQFTALTALDLLSSELTDTGLHALRSKLQNLRLLHLYQASVTADGLHSFAQQPAGTGLRSLVLYGAGALRELSCLGAFPALQELQLGSLCDLSAQMATALLDMRLSSLTSLTLERMDGLTVPALASVLRGCQQLRLLRVRGCDGVSQDDMEEFARDAAAECGSSASVQWAASPSCDTDDEEEGWQALAPF